MTAVHSVDEIICTKEFIAAHPELYHYTDAAGFEGIVSSNTLWATDFRKLNDARELVEVRDPLAIALTPRFGQYFNQNPFPAYMQEIFAQYGGSLGISSYIVAKLFAFFDDIGSEPASLAVFITSFCTIADGHPADNGDLLAYERENGRLSQWRGYGARDGYCIVFDTEKLELLLTSEGDQRFWSSGPKLREVAYGTASAPAQRLVTATCAAAIETLDACRHNREPGPDGTLQFLTAATLCKHQGFYEEHEARIIAIRPSETQMKQFQPIPGFQEKPLPEVTDEPNGRPHVVLFARLGQPLPIKRVIVGPSHDQPKNVRLARRLAAARPARAGFDVIASATPWRPPPNV